MWPTADGANTFLLPILILALPAQVDLFIVQPVKIELINAKKLSLF